MKIEIEQFGSTAKITFLTLYHGIMKKSTQSDFKSVNVKKKSQKQSQTPIQTESEVIGNG